MYGNIWLVGKLRYSRSCILETPCNSSCAVSHCFSPIWWSDLPFLIPESVADKAKLSGFKQHSLRHTFATRLLALGVDISIVSKLLGHSSIETTMIYAKATLDTLRGAIRTLDTFHNQDVRLASPTLGTKITTALKLLE